MSLTETISIPLGFKAPDFELPDVLTDQCLSLRQIRGKTATVIMFICNHCPYVKHIQTGMVELANDYLCKEVAFVGINSNDAEQYPEDAPDKMREVALKFAYPFPYLFDETQQVAKDYHAACTPDFAVFDKELICVYRGQMDDARPGNGIPVTGKDIRYVLDCLMHGRPIPKAQKPSVGCSIKWKK